MAHQLRLGIRPERFAICQLAAGTPAPEWLPDEGLISITWTEEETSIVCREEAIPSEIPTVSRGWRALGVEGPLGLDEVGVMAEIARPLAAAGISIYVLSTYNTDVLLVPEQMLGRAMRALQGAGHLVCQ